MRSLLSYFAGGLLFLGLLVHHLAAWWTQRDSEAWLAVCGLVLGGALAVLVRW